LQSQVEVWLARRGSPKGAEDFAGSSRAAQAAEIILVAKARKMAAEAEKIELANARVKGQLIDRDEVLIEVEEKFCRIRDRIMLLPDQVLVELPAEAKAAAAGVLRRAVTSLLNEMANWAAQVTE